MHIKEIKCIFNLRNKIKYEENWIQLLQTVTITYLTSPVVPCHWELEGKPHGQAKYTMEVASSQINSNGM